MSKPYTVTLLYPDYMADQFGEAFAAHVRATDGNAAIVEARREAAAANACTESDDFAVISVYAGHLEQAPWG